MPHQFSCGDCGFHVRSDDDEEVIRHVQDHAHEAHDREASASAIRDGMEEVH